MQSSTAYFFVIFLTAFNQWQFIKFKASLCYDTYVSKRERSATQAFNLGRGLKCVAERYSNLERCRSNIVPKEFTVDIKFVNLSLTLKSVSSSEKKRHRVKVDMKLSESRKLILTDI